MLRKAQRSTNLPHTYLEIEEGRMKKHKLAMGLSLTILVAFSGSGAVHAKGAANPSKPATASVDPIQSQNKRALMPHSDRKAAATHLKVAHQNERAEEMALASRQRHAEHGNDHARKGGVK